MPPTKQTFKRKTAKRASSGGRASSRPPARKSTRKRTAPQGRNLSEANLVEAQLEELLLEGLETEKGGVLVYEAALTCAQNEDLRKEWEEYRDQTQHHVEVYERLCSAFDVDANRETPGRLVVRHLGESLVQAIREAKESGNPEAAQLVACECICMAELKDHHNWELLQEVVPLLEGERQDVLREATEEVEEEEDKHYYHNKGWARELWLKSLGLPAVLPPPEEKRDVTSAASAQRAKKARKTMVRRSR